MNFDCIAITATTDKLASAYENELKRTLKQDFPNLSFIIVPDPIPGSAMGSGGTTINALSHIAEYLAAKEDYGAMSIDILVNKKILILHSGGTNLKTPYETICGESWGVLPFDNQDCFLITSIILMLKLIIKITKNAPSGLFVCMSHTLINIKNLEEMNWNLPGVTLLGVPSNVKHSQRFGVLKKHSSNSEVIKYYLHLSPDEIRQKDIYYNQSLDQVLIDTGIIFFDNPTTIKLLDIHMYSPLDSCTLNGIDEGAEPLNMNLFRDYLYCLGGNGTILLSDEDYFNLPTQNSDKRKVISARRVLRKTFRDTKFHMIIDPEGSIMKLDSMSEILSFCNNSSKWPVPLQRNTHYITNLDNNHKNTIINSIIRNGKIGTNNVIMHCDLIDNFQIGDNCILSGVNKFHNIYLQNDLCFYEMIISEKQSVGVILGINDDPCLHYTQATFINIPFNEFLNSTEFNVDDIWPNIPESERKLENAKLYPVIEQDIAIQLVLWLQDYKNVSKSCLHQYINMPRYSLIDLYNVCDPRDQFQYRWNIYCNIGLQIMRYILVNKKNKMISNIFKYVSGDVAQVHKYLNELDNIAANSSYDITARCFSWVSDLLTAHVKETKQIQSGPGNNPLWNKSNELLVKGNIREAISNMASIRNEWFSHPEYIIRASRHYMRQCQTLISKCVLLTPRFISYHDNPLPYDQWVEYKLPARLNYMGGWLDLPPLTYELPHLAITLESAILLDGEKPLRAYCRRIREPVIRIIPFPGTYSSVITVSTLEQMQDYCQPAAPGSLIKATILALKMIDIDSGVSLKDQLLNNINGGLEVSLNSLLPKGCGLGGSSIIAAAIVMAICHAVGIIYTHHFMFYCVLATEQLLTTGGGWADQVGIVKGFNVISCDNKLPIELSIIPVSYANEFVDTISQHLVFIYTGIARLARNLVQNTIREWYKRSPKVMNVCETMMRNVPVVRRGIEESNLEAVGKGLQLHRECKTVLSNGCPPFVTKIIDAISPICHGVGMCGAGGGGFVNCITKNPNAIEDLRKLLIDANIPMDGIHFSRGSIDTNGPEFFLIDDIPKSP